jgi:prolyl-tRNA synthetase
MAETLRMLEVYRAFSEEVLAMPVVAGEKPENERFPGAENTFSIEAMMQDGKALQAGTSHYLGQNFAKAQNIRFQTDKEDLAFCHTTSWGVSTRMVGGVIMTHGDDDGLRLPPAIAPRQIVIVPMLRDKPEDVEVLAYCDALAADLLKGSAFGAPLRVLVDKKPIRSAEKRWNWVRRGAPLILEIGPRDAAGGQVTFMRRDQLRDGDRVRSQSEARDAFVQGAPRRLAEIQAALFAEAKARLADNIRTDIDTFEGLEAHFGAAVEDDEAGAAFKGWVRAGWSRPEGGELEGVVERLKALKLTLRNAPMDQGGGAARCIFTGRPAVEDILIARAY